MARRHTARYSPGATGTETPAGASGGNLGQRRPARAGARVNLLFVLPFLFAVTAFFQGPVGLALDLGAFGLLMLAAWLTREGERAHEAFDARRVARRPALPRKLLAAGLMGAGVGLGAAAPGTGLLAPLVLGGLAAGLHLGAFGLDPMRDKGIDGAERLQGARVMRALEDAERHLDAMRAAIAPTADRDLIARVERFRVTARGLLDGVAADPRDLAPARRYLSIYLEGARDATRRYADLAARGGGDQGARDAYAALLDDLDSRFAERTTSLMRNDRLDLDVEIEVLRERLALDAPASGRTVRPAGADPRP